MSFPYEHPYEFTPKDGPSAGSIVFLPRRYEAFGSDAGGGLYAWDDKAEGYVWLKGMTLDRWLKERQK